jgi:hypothetical protein
MTSRNFALVAGIVYVLVGILGFVPAVLTSPPADAPPLAVDQGYGYLFGLFPVNLVHTLVHLAVGVWGVVAARRFGTSRTYAQSLAVIFGVLTVMGVIPRLNTVFGLVPLFGHDIWLHAVTAVVAAYFGFSARERVSEIADRTRRAA